MKLQIPLVISIKHTYAVIQEQDNKIKCIFILRGGGDPTAKEIYKHFTQ